MEYSYTAKLEIAIKAVKKIFKQHGPDKFLLNEDGNLVNYAKAKNFLWECIYIRDDGFTLGCNLYLNKYLPNHNWIGKIELITAKDLYKKWPNLIDRYDLPSLSQKPAFPLPEYGYIHIYDEILNDRIWRQENFLDMWLGTIYPIYINKNKL